MSKIPEKPTLEEATKPVAKPMDIEPDAKLSAWQDEQTRLAIEEADAGDFATAEEMKATIRKFVPNG